MDDAAVPSDAARQETLGTTVKTAPLTLASSVVIEPSIDVSRIEHWLATQREHRRLHGKSDRVTTTSSVAVAVTGGRHMLNSPSLQPLLLPGQARNQPSDDGGSFFLNCGPLPVPSSLPSLFLPSHPFSLLSPPLPSLPSPLPSRSLRSRPPYCG